MPQGIACLKTGEVGILEIKGVPASEILKGDEWKCKLKTSVIFELIMVYI